MKTRIRVLPLKRHFCQPVPTPSLNHTVRGPSSHSNRHYILSPTIGSWPRKNVKHSVPQSSHGLSSPNTLQKSQVQSLFWDSRQILTCNPVTPKRTSHISSIWSSLINTAISQEMARQQGKIREANRVNLLFPLVCILVHTVSLFELHQTWAGYRDFS